MTGTICKWIFGLAQKIWTSPKHFGTCKRTRHYIDDQAEHVDELSNQEVPKFGFEDCADVGNVSDEIDFYGDDSKKIVDVKNFEDDGRTLEIECCDEDFKKTIDAKNLTESNEIERC